MKRAEQRTYYIDDTMGVIRSDDKETMLTCATCDVAIVVLQGWGYDIIMSGLADEHDGHLGTISRNSMVPEQRRVSHVVRS